MIPPVLSTMIDGDWVLSLVKILIGGLTGGAGVAWWATKRKSKQKVQLEEPTKVQTERVYTPPTHWQHRSLEKRVGAIETRQDSMEREARDNFMKLMEAGETRQNRIMDKMDEMKTSIDKRIDEKLK